MCDWSEDEWEAEYEERTEEGTGVSLNVNHTYRTLEGEKAVVMYITNPIEPVFIGHILSEGLPIAVQWGSDGTADRKFYSDSFDIIGLWKDPEKYIRYVYVYQDAYDIKTRVEETPTKVHNVLASERIILLRDRKLFP